MKGVGGEEEGEVREVDGSCDVGGFGGGGGTLDEYKRQCSAALKRCTCCLDRGNAYGLKGMPRT